MCVALLGRERPQASAGDPPAGGSVLCGAQGVFGMGETLASTLVGLVRRIGLSDRLVGWVAFQALGCGVPPTTQRPLADKRAPF